MKLTLWQMQYPSLMYFALITREVGAHSTKISMWTNHLAFTNANVEDAIGPIAAINTSILATTHIYISLSQSPCIYKDVE